MIAAYIERCGGAENLQVGSFTTHTLRRENDVLVRLKTSSLNHLDLWIRNGIPSLKLNFPHILGADGAGEIVEVNKKGGQFKAGDRVIVHPGLSCGECKECLSGVESLCAQYKILGEHVQGTNAEYIVVPEENLFLIPSKQTFEEAASIALVFTTAWEMLKKARAERDQLVLIHGAGSSVTLAALQIARSLGLETVVTSTSDEKLEQVKKMGAHYALNSSRVDFLDEIKKISRKGVDIILDHVGQVFWERNIRLLRSGGSLVICGATSGPEGRTDLRHVFYRQLRILGSTMGSKRDFPEILSRFEKEEFRPFVNRVFKLSEIRDAHAFLEHGKQFGKVVLSIP